MLVAIIQQTHTGQQSWNLTHKIYKIYPTKKDIIKISNEMRTLSNNIKYMKRNTDKISDEISKGNIQTKVKGTW